MPCGKCGNFCGGYVPLCDECSEKSLPPDCLVDNEDGSKTYIRFRHNEFGGMDQSEINIPSDVVDVKAYMEKYDNIRNTVQKHFLKHTLYQNGDKDAPASIKDRNGDVVLSLCRVCGNGEGDLNQPCVVPRKPCYHPTINGVPVTVNGAVGIDECLIVQNGKVVGRIIDIDFAGLKSSEPLSEFQKQMQMCKDLAEIRSKKPDPVRKVDPLFLEVHEYFGDLLTGSPVATQTQICDFIVHCRKRGLIK